MYIEKYSLFFTALVGLFQRRDCTSKGDCLRVLLLDCAINARRFRTALAPLPHLLIFSSALRLLYSTTP